VGAAEIDAPRELATGVRLERGEVLLEQER